MSYYVAYIQCVKFFKFGGQTPKNVLDIRKIAPKTFIVFHDGAWTVWTSYRCLFRMKFVLKVYNLLRFVITLETFWYDF